MMIRMDIEKPNHDRNGSLLFRLQVHKLCLAIIARWVGFEWIKSPSTWVISFGFVQIWNMQIEK